MGIEATVETYSMIFVLRWICDEYISGNADIIIALRIGCMPVKALTYVHGMSNTQSLFINTETVPVKIYIKFMQL